MCVKPSPKNTTWIGVLEEGMDKGLHEEALS
jgi:hypothetical protein